jgi:nucleotidyltransferase substrate binding protein (TIGR01987 family)
MENLKVFLEFEGHEVSTPRQTLKEAFRIQWIADEPGWHQMLDDRNQTSHTYQEALADEIYSRLPEHYARMIRLCSRLEQQIASA